MNLRLIAGTLALALATLASPQTEPASAAAPTVAKHSVRKGKGRRAHAKRHARRKAVKHARNRSAKTAVRL